MLFSHSRESYFEPTSAGCSSFYSGTADLSKVAPIHDSNAHPLRHSGKYTCHDNSSALTPLGLLTNDKCVCFRIPRTLYPGYTSPM